MSRSPYPSALETLETLPCKPRTEHACMDALRASQQLAQALACCPPLSHPEDKYLAGRGRHQYQRHQNISASSPHYSSSSPERGQAEPGGASCLQRVKQTQQHCYYYQQQRSQQQQEQEQEQQPELGSPTVKQPGSPTELHNPDMPRTPKPDTKPAGYHYYCSSSADTCSLPELSPGDQSSGDWGDVTGSAALVHSGEVGFVDPALWAGSSTSAAVKQLWGICQETLGGAHAAPSPSSSMTLPSGQAQPSQIPRVAGQSGDMRGGGSCGDSNSSGESRQELALGSHGLQEVFSSQMNAAGQESLNAGAGCSRALEQQEPWLSPFPLSSPGSPAELHLDDDQSSEPGAPRPRACNGKIPADAVPERKLRRLISNRASAKRSRQRKQDRLQELELLTAKLKVEQGDLNRSLSLANEQLKAVEMQNKSLMRQVGLLKQSAGKQLGVRPANTNADRTTLAVEAVAAPLPAKVVLKGDGQTLPDCDFLPSRADELEAPLVHEQLPDTGEVVGMFEN